MYVCMYIHMYVCTYVFVFETRSYSVAQAYLKFSVSLLSVELQEWVTMSHVTRDILLIFGF